MVTLQPTKGRLLIAEPSILNDVSFNRSIILLTEHTPNNTIGFILNKPLDYKLSDLVPSINCDFKIYQGGPVEQDNLYFVHNVPNLIPNSLCVDGTIYWGGDFDILTKLLNSNQLNSKNIRFFLGYSGWNAQQLKEEIGIDSWFVSENDYTNIFAIDCTSIWKSKMLQKGGEYKIWANAPSDLKLN